MFDVTLACSFVNAHTLAVSGSSLSSLSSVAKGSSSWHVLKTTNEHFTGTVRYGDEVSFVNDKQSYLAVGQGSKAALVAWPSAQVQFTLLNPAIADDRGFVATGDKFAARCSGGESYLTRWAGDSPGLTCKAASGGKFSPDQLFSLGAV
jgi:hypothetical protein